jgi:TetR/AcrR family transcriptional regulator, regulator of cefoperazone and chloramphenicol sensitivity
LKTSRKKKPARRAKRTRSGAYAPGVEARQRIILAALAVFGAEGFEGASTRVLSKRAGVGLPALQYYFGGKEGLYLECARHIAAQMKAALDPALARIAPLIEPSARTAPREAVAALQMLLDHVIDMLIGSSKAEPWVMFIIREQANPTSAFDLLYSEALGRVGQACTALVAKALGRSPEEPDVRVRGFAVLGQIIAFRAAHAAALRSLNWANFDAERLEITKKALRAHTLAALQ